MTLKPVGDARPNSYAFETRALVKPSGFREYDARWWFGHPDSTKEPEINLIGVQALGMGLGTLICRLGVGPDIVTGHDFRSYSMAIKLALVSGLMAAGCAREGRRPRTVAAGVFRPVRAGCSVGSDGDGFAQRERLDRR